MVSEALESGEQTDILEHLQAGENVILIGPNQAHIERLALSIRSELSKRTKLGSVRAQNGHLPGTFERELLDAQALGANYFVAEGISPEQTFSILSKHSHFTLFATMPQAHVLGVQVAWARLLQSEFGEKSRLAADLLIEFLKTLRVVGVSFSSSGVVASGSFREKLLFAKYNQGRPVTDHGTLLKDWTGEGDACDPGWELDRSK